MRYRQGRLIGRMESLGFDLLREAVLETLTSKYAKLTQSSQETALHDIVPLVEGGILVRGPERGRSTGYALADDYRPAEGAS